MIQLKGWSARRAERARGRGAPVVLGLLAMTALVLLLAAATPRPARAADASANDCTVADDTLSLDDAESQMLDVVNRYRESLYMPAVQFSRTLERAARWKAASLADAGATVVDQLEHNDPDGRSWDQRFLDCGYPPAADFGENLGVTIDTIEDLFAAWLQSPTHQANLANPRFAFMGVARAAAGQFAGQQLVIWVMDFGTVDP